MDNVIPLNTRLKREDPELQFDECVAQLSEGFKDKTLEPGKWFMFTVTPDGVPMLSINGFQPGEVYFIMDAVKDWLKRP